MRILLFAKKRKRRSRSGGKGPSIEPHAMTDLEAVIPSLEDGALVYLDLTGLGAAERQKVLAVIRDNPRVLFGVLDPAGMVEDIAALFHGGVVDYVGRKMKGSRLTARRISRVLMYADGGAATDVVEDAPAIPLGASRESSVAGWSKIVPGREYEFAILFIEVDGSEELKRRHEPENLAGAMDSFRSYVERIASSHGGRTWMWSQFGGLVLFPLRKGDSSAPLCGLRMMLWRIFYDVEESLLPGHLSFHLALSTGTTVYRQRDTGEIISEGINSVFHLGKRYTRPAQFFISNDAMSLVPLKLRFLCVPVGSYEGKRIFRMIPPRPVLIAGDGSGQRKK